VSFANRPNNIRLHIKEVNQIARVPTAF
jgi:hypothetical protein